MSKKEFNLDLEETFAEISLHDIRNLEGRILTIVDASLSDQQQKKAVKDIVKQTIWWGWAENLEGRTDKDFPVGIPLD